jgi:hypothetical protein
VTGKPAGSVQPLGVAQAAVREIEHVTQTSRSPVTFDPLLTGESVVDATTLFAVKTAVPAARNAGAAIYGPISPG